MRAILFAASFASSLVACGASTAPPAEPSAEAARADPHLERRAAEGEPIEASVEGACGGLTSLALEQERAALDGRVGLLLPADAEGSPAPHDIMSAPDSLQRTEVLWLHAGDARMAIVVEELFRTAGERLASYVEGTAPEGWRARALEARDGIGGVVLEPHPLRDVNGDVVLLEAWAVDADDLVMRVTVVTSPEIARTGGCAALAGRVVRTLARGRRSVRTDGGERALAGDLAITLPARHVLVVDEGPDFSVYRVLPLLPIDAAGASLGIYVGHHPSFEAPAGATTRVTRTLDRDVTWYESDEDGARSVDALIDLDEAVLHVFYGATDEATLGPLRAIAESLHRVPATR